MTAIRLRGGIRWLLVSLLVLTFALLGRTADIGQQIEGQYGLYPDLAANLRLQTIANRVAMGADYPNVSFKIFNDRELNAFALPDGRIFVTSLMATAVTDDELAFVLGHEITHVKEGHAKRQSQRATGGALLGALLGAVLGGGESDIRLGADILGGLTLGHYSRKDERRSDEQGILYMTRAGYDPMKAADAMQRLIDQYGDGDADVPVLGWFATHPDTKNRRGWLQELATQYQQHPIEKLPAPTGVVLTLDPSAQHADAWLESYTALQLAKYGEGRAVLLLSPQTLNRLREVAPPMPTKKEIERARDRKDKDKAKEPLPRVALNIPQVPVGYHLTVGLRNATPQVTIGQAKPETVVEADVRWTHAATGFTNRITVTARANGVVPWQAQGQLAAGQEILRVSGGEQRNLDGTLEAAAIRRAMRALAEVVEAGGPVHHDTPVTLKAKEKGLRVGDYVYVIRGNEVVSEVRIDAFTSKKNEFTGSVLWGSHTTKKGDEVLKVD